MSLPTAPTPLPTLAEADRTPALVIHLSPLLGFVLPPIGALLGPIGAWLLYRDRSAALDEQGKEAVNFQLSVWLYHLVAGAAAFFLFSLGLFGTAVTGGADGGAFAVLGGLGAFFGFYLPVLALLSLVPFIFMLLAVLRVSGGQRYRYPLTIRFLR
ncbi:DUF4870 domain-containing protein [Deinococcus taklimakanensis]|uniref:DUF4870 domain-containing protein n=1 Tax=Deinococcus taklimakanensis TaxID=536443 RepID=A0ABW5P226_9DEIO